MASSYEIEIKSLLGSVDNAASLRDAMRAGDGGMESVGTHKQLNHYFTGGDLQALKAKLAGHIASPDKKSEFEGLVDRVKNFSTRTRWADGRVIFVMKISVDDTTSANGTARLEFEADVDLDLDALDRLLLDCGFQYQAKWSREREEYKYGGMNVTIDKNAGYGYVAEFERVVADEGSADAVKKEIRDAMQKLGAEELPQERLERMFQFYNEHWQEYYGTDKIFVIN